MGLEDLIGTALVVGGTIYVVDKLTGKKRKIKIPPHKHMPRRAVKSGVKRVHPARLQHRAIKSPKKSGSVKRSTIRKAVRKSPPKRAKRKSK